MSQLSSLASLCTGLPWTGPGRCRSLLWRPSGHKRRVRASSLTHTHPTPQRQRTGAGPANDHPSDPCASVAESGRGGHACMRARVTNEQGERNRAVRVFWPSSFPPYPYPLPHAMQGLIGHQPTPIWPPPTVHATRWGKTERGRRWDGHPICPVPWTPRSTRHVSKIFVAAVLEAHQSKSEGVFRSSTVGFQRPGSGLGRGRHTGTVTATLTGILHHLKSLRAPPTATPHAEQDGPPLPTRGDATCFDHPPLRHSWS